MAARWLLALGAFLLSTLGVIYLWGLYSLPEIAEPRLPSRYAQSRGYDEDAAGVARGGRRFSAGGDPLDPLDPSDTRHRGQPANSMSPYPGQTNARRGLMDRGDAPTRLDGRGSTSGSDSSVGPGNSPSASGTSASPGTHGTDPQAGADGSNPTTAAQDEADTDTETGETTAESEPEGDGGLRGMVVDPEGLGIPEATVGWSCFRCSFRNLEAATLSAADGRFLLQGVPANITGVVVAAHPEFAMGVSEGVLIAEGVVNDEIIIVLGSEGGTIRGRTITTAGEQLEGVEVTLNQTGYDAVLDRAVSDGYGEFVFSGVPSGQLSIGAVLAEPRSYESQRVQVAAGQTVEVDLVFDVGAGTISGWVEDESGNAVPSVTVRAHPEVAGGTILRAVSDGDGAFEVTDLTTGTYGVGFDRAGWDPVYFAGVAAGTAGLEVIMRRGGTIEGEVIGGQVGGYGGDYIVSIAPADGASLGASPSTRYSQERFTSQLPHLGVFDVVAVGSDGRIGITRAVEISAETAVAEVTIVLASDSVAHGRVISEATGATISAALVRVVWPGRPSLSPHGIHATSLFAGDHTDELGQFSVGVIPGNPVRLFVTAPGFFSESWTSEPWQGERTIGDVVLRVR